MKYLESDEIYIVYKGNKEVVLEWDTSTNVYTLSNGEKILPIHFKRKLAQHFDTSFEYTFKMLCPRSYKK